MHMWGTLWGSEARVRLGLGPEKANKRFSSTVEALEKTLCGFHAVHSSALSLMVAGKDSFDFRRGAAWPSLAATAAGQDGFSILLN